MKHPYIALLLAILLLACNHGTEGWKQVSTPNFHLFTQTPERTYQSAFERLETVHAGLKASFFPETTIPPLQVLLLTEHEFHELLGPIGGVFIRFAGQHGMLVFYDSLSFEFFEAVAAHELAHGFIGAAFPRVPDWFNEGFACYLETLQVDGERVWFGHRTGDHVREAAIGQLIPLGELFATKYKEFHHGWERAHYSTSWAFVHYLVHGENNRFRPHFTTFAATLSANPVNPRGVLAAVWPDMQIAELDDRLRDHMSTLISKPSSRRMGFKFLPPGEPKLTVEPADMTYINEVRKALIKIRRPDRF